jgi:hypothetical protein
VHDWTGDWTGRESPLLLTRYGARPPRVLSAATKPTPISLYVPLYVTRQAIPAGREATKEWSEEKDDEMMWSERSSTVVGWSALLFDGFLDANAWVVSALCLLSRLQFRASGSFPFAVLSPAFQLQLSVPQASPERWKQQQ